MNANTITYEIIEKLEKELREASVEMWRLSHRIKTEGCSPGVAAKQVRKTINKLSSFLK